MSGSLYCFRSGSTPEGSLSN